MTKMLAVTRARRTPYCVLTESAFFAEETSPCRGVSPCSPGMPPLGVSLCPGVARATQGHRLIHRWHAKLCTMAVALLPCYRVVPVTWLQRMPLPRTPGPQSPVPAASSPPCELPRPSPPLPGRCVSQTPPCGRPQHTRRPSGPGPLQQVSPPGGQVGEVR